MVDSRCHSFEDASWAGHHNNPSLVSLISQSESAKDDGNVGLIEFATIHLPLLESPAASQVSLPLKPMAKAPAHIVPRFKENQTTSPERGRARARGLVNGDVARRALGSSVSPDRFIPKRAFGDLPSTAFHVTKHPDQLSPQEKITRRRLPVDSPFLPSPGRRPATVTGPPRQTPLRQGPHHRPRLVTESGFTRQVSSGAVWGVGGTSPAVGDPQVVSNGTRNISSRGSTAPVFVAQFLPKITATDEQDKHESRVALALDIDPTSRLLGTCQPCPSIPPSPASPDYERFSPFVWKDCAWKRGEREHWPAIPHKREVVPPKPFRILDAPYLRDDFYCSTLAYSLTAGVLAVGLAQHVYLWSEKYGVEYPPFRDMHMSNYVTSLSFSSEDGARSILAVGRQSGQLSLWSTFETNIRFELSHPTSITCVAFKPRTSRRLSERFANVEVEAEDLAVGDEMGNVWYYSVEWPDDNVRIKWKWKGSMTLLAKISAHTQQVCGLAWSPDDRFLATGGNDNVCLLFELRKILSSLRLDYSTSLVSSADSRGRFHVNTFPCFSGGTAPKRLFSKHHVSHLLPSWIQSPPIKATTAAPLLSHMGTLISGSKRTVIIPPDHQKHRLLHAAAVKAIAFAPWQPSLLATGGGSNDRAIHFYHTRTGACLARINVFAQVTSLIWSQTRREIAATFGYAQPEHPFRIAVFAWPSCVQVAVIPWGPYGTTWDGHSRGHCYDGGRALWAVSYPGRPPRPMDEHEDAALDESDSIPTSASSLSSPTQSSERIGVSSEPHRRPRGPRIVRPKEKEGGMWCSRTMEEGCIIVASSDQTVKFHEVWTGRRKSTGSACGLLGGSDILESLEGIEKFGSEVIR
ncbi:hypothetical protein NUU61_003866 [Penicillium alfredii]|uniref:Anaphase-promoting complex subunit 4 WD40 domain-containing protein n=1 Tax=Penicillium alfredii TaxID=1506179 RepID=A0A9W9FK90_9EURO|nr:uncharacterized protein NUU61_003866 [Penicillium alfredii]KAJ5101644.1 hypothetical protein NUU61_003866 [Penicillium alfredii]